MAGKGFVEVDMEIFDLDMIKTVSGRMAQRVSEARQAVGHPLTLAEKILYSHLYQPGKISQGGFLRGKDYVELAPDRVAMQDATAQMALLQLMSTSIKRVRIPSTVHCDHLIEAESGSATDLARAESENAEVYSFLSQSSQRFGIGFWKPGSGIIHQVILENYAFPGALLIGTDSHTPNAGGMSMLAIGVGGADAVDAMVGLPWEIKWPKVLGVRLTGRLQGWASPKDVILKLSGMLTVLGGTGYIVEYFGPGTATLSATGKATICNMGAEIGATTSVFPYDERSAAYLRATNRGEVVNLMEALVNELCADPEVVADPARYYDKVVEIDLSTLEPHVNGPFTPDRAHALSEFGTALKKNNWPEVPSVALIGSCTNSSYEDIGRVFSLARAALDKGLKLKTELMITPGSERVRATLERDGQLVLLEKLGAKIYANACGPCIGQWKRAGAADGKPNSIVTSFNRNFTGRNDGNPNTCAFVASPETVFAFALAGNLAVDYVHEGFPTEDGGRVMLPPPSASELPELGFSEGTAGYVRPPDDGTAIEVRIDPASKRLQKLEPFPQPDPERDFEDLPVLLKVKGKCTTDHISPAGKWLAFRGHLDNISNNMFLTAQNAFMGTAGQARNVVTGEAGPVVTVARDYKERKMGWVVVAEENYGEGSSREHAAMEPRHLGCRMVIAKSFARIHETNLKKQGLLPFTFVNPADYDVITADCRLSLDPRSIAPGRTSELTVQLADGSRKVVLLNHTFSEAQLAWFFAGSALNLISM